MGKGDTFEALSDDARLQLENADLRLRLLEAEETLVAIRQGDVDALVVGEDVYTLDSSNAAANRLRQDVLAQMDDAVLAFDEQDHLIYLNAAAERHYRQTASHALGRPKAELFDEIWADEAARADCHAGLRAHGAFRCSLIHRHRDGLHSHVEVAVSRLRDGGGTRGQLYVIRNIDDRVRVERELAATTAALAQRNDALQESQLRLQEADGRKDEFLATLAHELRNPLAPIRNALQIMHLSQKPELHAEARHIVERQLVQMVHLVDDLLDVSRISRGKLQLRLEVADLVEVVQSAIETSRPLIEAGRHELTVEIPLAQTLFVNADVTRLCQVVSNLLNNAAKYTPEGGRIRLAAWRQDQRALVSVQDNGVGIPADMLPRVFEMFTQVARSAERAQGGLGIGLALVKQLVDLHGGTVEAHSEGPGRGSIFVVSLPLAERPPRAEQAGSSSRLRAGVSSGSRVLIVDDNVDAAVTLKTLLDILGYETAAAHDGEEAIRQAESFQPDVVVLDIGLPLRNGYEVARHIRACDWGRHMVLLALSGWGQDADKQQAREAGFDRHFVKPVDLEELTQAVSIVQPRRA